MNVGRLSDRPKDSPDTGQSGRIGTGQLPAMPDAQTDRIRPGPNTEAAKSMARLLLTNSDLAFDLDDLRATRNQIFRRRPVAKVDQPADVRELLQRAARVYDVIATGNQVEVSVAINALRTQVVNMLRTSKSLLGDITSVKADAILQYFDDTR